MNYSPTKWGNPDAYRLPDDGKFRTINFSGGRSSAYMLHQIWQAHDGVLPETCRVFFCNTGKEREQTLEFVRRCAEAWNVDVVWLEYDYNFEAKGGRADPKKIHRVVTFETASRAGEPFALLNRNRSMLPNVKARSCTSELKVETINRYCARVLGWPKKQVRRVVGFRYDEPRRWQKAIVENCDLEFPMVHARVSRADVQGFWDAAPFDLGIHSERGNCDLCFLKATGNLVATMREDPSLADWWIDQEQSTIKRKHLREMTVAQFSKRWRYADLRDIALNQPEFQFIDDGEGIDCFCTD